MTYDDLLARLDVIAGGCYDTDDTAIAESLSKAVDTIRQLSAELEAAKAEIARLMHEPRRRVDTKPWGSTGVLR